MRICLFCENPYAVGILDPLQREAARTAGEHSVLWFVGKRVDPFPLDGQVEWTRSMQEVKDFNPEAIFVPGNIVPYYLPGVKCQIFHGYAAEKKDHWVIRRYFDLYLTQGPYFTEHFKQLSRKYGDFDVVETGWTKQDSIARRLPGAQASKQALLKKYPGKKRLVLYAPTFSPKLTSLPSIMPGLEALLEANPDMLLALKFHPLTRPELADPYREWAAREPERVVYVEQDKDLTELCLEADLMVSDTSSAVYEFLLLNKPVVTLNTIARDIYWENITSPAELPQAVERALTDLEARSRREWISRNYDPHLDGQCCRRMIQAAEDFNRRNGVPRQRKVNLWRRYTSVKTFGKVK